MMRHLQIPLLIAVSLAVPATGQSPAKSSPPLVSPAQRAFEAQRKRWQAAIAAPASAQAFFGDCDLVVVARPQKLGKAPSRWCGGVVPTYQTVVFACEERLRGQGDLQRIPVRFPVLEGTLASRVDGVVGLSPAWFAADKRFLLGLKLDTVAEGLTLVYSAWASDTGIPLTSIDLGQVRRVLAEEPQDPGFPNSWIGSWAGDLVLSHPGGESRRVAMGLVLGPDPQPGKAKGPFRWQIRYGQGNAAELRKYELLTLNRDAGTYRVDEKDGTLLDAYLVGSTLYSRFQVGEVSIEAIYRRRGETMTVTMISTRVGAATTSVGKQKTGGKSEGKKISSHALIGVQRALLKRGQ